MKPRALLVVGLIALSAGPGSGACTCSPGAVAAESPLFAFNRDGFVQACCNCLATETIQVEADEFACPEALVVPDAGPDGGTARAGPVQTPCLCGDDADTCREKLDEGDQIEVVGLCIQRETRCSAPCDGVLAYPLEE